MSKNVRWNSEKAEANWRKHGVRFIDAATLFRDPFMRSVADIEHSGSENRYRAMGETIFNRIVVVIYCVRQDDYWLISAREASPSETRRYMREDRINDLQHREINFDDIPETDFTNAVVGLHYIPPRPGSIMRVSIDEDVSRYFSDEDSINDALRMLIAEGRAPEPRTE